jgi:hypothetical protein
MDIATRLRELTNDKPMPKLDENGFAIGGGRSRLNKSTDTIEIIEMVDKRKRYRARKRQDRERCIAILDFETDPFNNEKPEDNIYPFLSVLYSDQFEPIVIWDENFNTFVASVIKAIEDLPDHYTIYAHNGGKFDYMFLIHKLRGVIKFKGRGLMTARIGRHQLRDSFHIIPERLRTWKKDEFEYGKLSRNIRQKHKDEIIKYCINDCKYLLQIVRRFIKDNGIALSIGQASIRRLKQEYSFDTIGEHTDGMLRGVNTNARDKEGYDQPNGKGYFYGGRVECIAGADRFVGRYKLYDVNSMYPYVMAYYQHPIGASYSVREGLPDQSTAFIKLTCHNRGALLSRDEDGQTTADVEYGTFYTTIHEYNTAIELGLIEDVTVHECIDCDKFGDFSRFILPIYAERQQTKAQLAYLEQQGRTDGEAWDNTKLTDIFLKLYLNNAYGKFAQNPRKFRENLITGPGETPDETLWEHEYGCVDEENPELSHDVWVSKGPVWNEQQLSYNPQYHRFNNIGTGASITGAARSVLLRGLLRSNSPIYCDTDSIICLSLDCPVSSVDLGAWKLEKEFEEVVIVGKKQYAAMLADKKVDKATGLRYIARNKGVSNVTYREMVNLLGPGRVIRKKAKGMTLTKRGEQYYMERKIRRTAPLQKSLLGEYIYG